MRIRIWPRNTIKFQNLALADWDSPFFSFPLVNSYLPQVATDLMGGGASAAHNPGEISLCKLVFDLGRD
jgi:hypothetical protein